MNTLIIIGVAIIVSVCVTLLYYFLFDNKKKETKAEKFIKKSQATRKQINNINKHLKIADASQNLHEVRVHAHKAMLLIKKYGLVNEYRKLLSNKTK